MIADNPRISPIFTILLPTILPRAISGRPFNAPMKLTTNSGIDVPKATTVRPTTTGWIFNEIARREAPLTSQSEPK